jgi:hypothetical protein
MLRSFFLTFQVLQFDNPRGTVRFQLAWMIDGLPLYSRGFEIFRIKIARHVSAPQPLEHQRTTSLQ